MDENAKSEAENRVEHDIPLMPEHYVKMDRLKERRLKGLATLLLALALFLGSDSVWLTYIGLFLAGSGIVLLESILAGGAVLITLASLNSLLVNAEWISLFLLILIGSVAALSASFWHPLCQKFFRFTREIYLEKRFPDEHKKRFARVLVREFSPVMGFIVCVYTAFWLLGFLEEIITITIIASFAWLGKMEKYHGEYEFSGISVGKSEVMEDVKNLDKHLIVDTYHFLSMRAYASNTRKENPTLAVGVAKYRFGPLYFVLHAMHCEAEKKKTIQIYEFMELTRLLENAKRIEEDENKIKGIPFWQEPWAYFMVFENSPVLGPTIRHPVHDLSADAFMILIVFYFWYFIRYRYISLGNIVRVIGESMEKIIYMFHKSDAVSREKHPLAVPKKLW